MATTKAVLFKLVMIVLVTWGGAAFAQRSTAGGYTEERIGQLQQTLVDLTRRLEELRKQNQQLEQKLEKMQASYEQRLERLEKGTAAKAPAAPRKAPSRP